MDFWFLEMSNRKAIILDLDGTIYNWVDFFAPSFRAMVHVLSRLTRLDEEVIIQSFKRVYQAHNTLEYSFSVQELDIWESLQWPKEDIEEKAVKAARGAFRRVRKKHLSLYPGIKETLQWAKSQGLIIIAYTDSPRIQAEMRLKFLRTDNLFNRLHSLQDSNLPEGSDIPEDVINKMRAGKYSSKITIKSQFGPQDVKPSPETLRSLLNEFQLTPPNTYLVGDSIQKDIAGAQEVGIIDIWARYKNYSSKTKNIETILKITPWTKEQIAKSKEASQVIKPTYIIDSFAEIKEIIGNQRPSQLKLPL